MINPEVMGAQQKETFRGWYEIQIRYNHRTLKWHLVAQNSGI